MLPEAIDAILPIIEIMAIITVNNHAHPFPFRRPQEIMRVAMPRASVKAPTPMNIAAKPGSSNSLSPLSARPNTRDDSPKITDIIPLIIIRIAMIIIPLGRLLSILASYQEEVQYSNLNYFPCFPLKSSCEQAQDQR
jgi:hypothetical protein